MRVFNTRFARCVITSATHAQKFNSKMSWPRQENPPTASYRGTSHVTPIDGLSSSQNRAWWFARVVASHSRFARILVRAPVHRPNCHPSTRKPNTHTRAIRALIHLWPCCHRMCVIDKGPGSLQCSAYDLRSQIFDNCRFECCVLCARVSACFTPCWTTCEEDKSTLEVL